MARSAMHEYAEPCADAREEAHVQTHSAASDTLNERTINEFPEQEQLHDEHGDVLKGIRLAVIFGGLFWLTLVGWLILI